MEASSPPLERRYLTIREAAEYLRVSPQTLRQYRYLKKGPPSSSVGGRIIYRLDDLDEYIDSRVQPGDGRR